MKPLSKKAQVVFNKLFDGMTRVGDHKIVDAERGFMVVYLEIVGRETVKRLQVDCAGAVNEAVDGRLPALHSTAAWRRLW